MKGVIMDTKAKRPRYDHCKQCGRLSVLWRGICHGCSKKVKPLSDGK